MCLGGGDEFLKTCGRIRVAQRIHRRVYATSGIVRDRQRMIVLHRTSTVAGDGSSWVGLRSGRPVADPNSSGTNDSEAVECRYREPVEWGMHMCDSAQADVPLLLGRDMAIA